jgi:hypothetical protein
VVLDGVKDEVDPVLIPAVVHRELGLVVQLYQVSGVEVESLHALLARPQAEGDVLSACHHREVHTVRVADPVPRVVVRRNADAWGHCRQQAAHHLQSTNTR